MKEERFFYVPDASEVDCLPDEEAVHAVRVLRLKEGDEIFLLDGKGCFYKAVITLASQCKCSYNIEQKIRQNRTWKGRIHLAIAPTKMMERMEWMAEKATEIGFDELTFLDCKFSERKIVKLPRVEKIIVSAVKQSRKAWLPKVNAMTGFSEFVRMQRSGKKYICHCYDEVSRSDFFDSLSSVDTDGNDITVMVGPEGDFSIDEVKLALENGFESVSLGKSRLRTETAGLEAVMMANLCRRL